MGPPKPHIQHVAPAGYTRAENDEPDADRPGDCKPGSSQEKKVKSSKPHWLLEMAALFLCICAFVSTIVLLFFTHGKPLVDYPSFISLSASISILATVTRVSLGFALGSCLGQWKWNWFRKRSDSLAIFESFEDASRGPWGSFILVTNFKVRHWAALGALLTIVMLSFEPFLQSTIQYQGRMAASLGSSSKDSPPTLSWGDRVDAGVYQRNENENNFTAIKLPSGRPWSPKPYNSQPDIGMPIAIQLGLSRTFSPDRQTASFSCATGNCTWPIFTSISVCGRCNDVTDHLKKETIKGKNLGTFNLASDYLFAAENYTIYSLPYLNLSNLVYTKHRPQLTPALMTARPISNPGRTLTFTTLDTMIAAVGIIKADVAFGNKSVDWGESIVTATECALFLCTKAYNSSVDSGFLKEDAIASWENREPASYQRGKSSDQSTAEVRYADYDEAYNEIESLRNHSLVTNSNYDRDAKGSDIADIDVGDVPRSDLQLRIPADEAKAHGVPEDASLIFNITQNTVGSMGRFINFGLLQTRERRELVWPPIDSDASSQATVAQSLWNSSDLAVTFDNVALALSNWIRDSSGQQQRGNAWEYIIVVRVRWVYLTVPAVVVAAGCVFVLLSIWETQRLRLPAWRSSVISTLTHSLDAESRVQLRQADINGVLNTTCKETIVYLDDVSDGLELKLHVD